MASRFFTVLIALSMAAGAAVAQKKKRVDKAADLPRFSYAIEGRLEDTVRDDARFKTFAQALRRDTESVLAAYDIQDKATLRQMLGSLAQLDFLEGRMEAATAGLAKVKALQDKPSDKLLSGLQLDAVIAASNAVGDRSSPAYRAKVGELINAKLEPLPFEVVQNDVRELKAGNEIASESLALGYLREVLQPTVDKAGGKLSSEFSPSIVGVRFRLMTTLPLKDTLVATYGAYLDRHKVTKQDIWAARNVELAPGGTPVVIGIWDSGTDIALYKDRLVIDASGQPAVIAFDKYSKPASGALQALPADVSSRLAVNLARNKGFSDLQSNIDSAEASEVKRYLSTLKPEAYKPAVEELRLMANYVHGTHVAGIALAGNPNARLVVARIEFGYLLRPDPCPSKTQADADAKASQAYVDFLKKSGVQVVNMSWGDSVKEVESNIELCGIGKTPEERKALARQYFDISRNALERAFASAPSILFVAAAGNANTDSTFEEVIPAGIVLPNLLTVGAVDLAGDEASFTSYGPTVKVHANGYQVESTLPGGMIVAESGTSMAAPQVANVAAKVLSVNPKLTPREVIAIIVSAADTSGDGRRVLINAKRAVAAAVAK